MGPRPNQVVQRGSAFRRGVRGSLSLSLKFSPLVWSGLARDWDIGPSYRRGKVFSPSSRRPALHGRDPGSQMVCDTTLHPSKSTYRRPPFLPNMQALSRASGSQGYTETDGLKNERLRNQ